MRKTTVYLSDDEAEALKRASAASGKSQSELIREGVRRITRGRRQRRVFYSMGVAEGPGLPIGQMAEEILEREWAQDLDADR
jgi:Arc/MetJ-type ribon-helix-helix transcriptional regulator